MSVRERVKAISRNNNLTIDQKGTTAKIELCGLCSLNCKFCAHPDMRCKGIRQRMMTKDEFELVLNWLQERRPDVKEIGLFYMGESGLHPYIDQAYAALKERGYFTFLTTNATKIVHILRAIPYVDSLKVSWNYKNRADFMAKTRMPAMMFDIIQHNLNVLYHECHNRGKQLAVSTVLDGPKEDYEEVLETLAYDEHYWIPLQTQGGTFENGQDGVVGESESAVSPLPCWSLFKGVYVDCELNVRTCCYGHGKEHIIGNLRNNWDTIPDYHEEARRLQLEGKIPTMCKECLCHQ